MMIFEHPSQMVLAHTTEIASLRKERSEDGTSAAPRQADSIQGWGEYGKDG